MTAKASEFYARFAPRSRISRLAPLLLVALALPLASACSRFDRMSSEEALVETIPAKGHPIAFIERDEVIDIEMPPHDRGLGHNQYVDVYRFALRYKEEATGPLAVSIPGGRYDQHRRHPAIADVRRALHAAGVDPKRIQSASPTRGAVVTLAYHRPQAVAPQCGHWDRNVGREDERVPYPDFGCATQRNLANMVANGRDLMASQEESPASSERRLRTWSKYVSGDAGGAQATAAPESTDAKPKAGKK